MHGNGPERRKPLLTTSSPIVASRLIAVPPVAVFRYLEDLANHTSLAPRSAQVLSFERRPGSLDRAVVRLDGPLGIRRTASTELVRGQAPSLIAGRARIGARTEACVTWRIASAPQGSLVVLHATVEAAGPLDAILLRLGGRGWIARRFAAALESLAHHLVASAEMERASGRTLSGALLAPSPAASGDRL
jgi:hypothetical protein